MCVCVCVRTCVVHWHKTESAGKLNISSERFQAWSAMKAQLCDASGTAHTHTTTARALPLIITLYQSWQSFYLSVSIRFPFEISPSLIYLPFSFYSFCIHPTLSPLGSSQAASAGSMLWLFFFVFFVGGGGCFWMVGV